MTMPAPRRIHRPLILCISIAALGLPATAPAATVAYWPLDELSDTGAGLVDLVSGLDLQNGEGVLFGRSPLVDPVPTPDPAAGPANDGAIHFGPSTAAYSRFAPALAITAGASLTFEGFFLCETIQGPGINGLIGGTLAVPGATGWVLRLENGGRLGFEVDGPLTPQAVFTPTEVHPVVVDGAAHHFALVWDHDGGTPGGGKLTLYVDAQVYGELDGVTAPATNDVFVLGSSFSPGLLTFPGVLDEVRVSDTALAPTAFLSSLFFLGVEEELVSNLQGSFLGYVGETVWAASEFRTDDRGWLLQSILADLRDPDPSTQMHVYADDSGEPGALLASFGAPVADGPLSRLELAEPLPLEPDTSYWIVLEPGLTRWAQTHAIANYTGPGELTLSYFVTSADGASWAQSSGFRLQAAILGIPLPPVPDGLYVDFADSQSWDASNPPFLDPFDMQPPGQVFRNVAGTGLDLRVTAVSFNGIPSPDGTAGNHDLRLRDNPGAMPDPAVRVELLNGVANLVLTDPANLQSWETITVQNPDGRNMRVWQLANPSGDFLTADGLVLPALGLPVAVGSQVELTESDNIVGSTFLVEVPAAREFTWGVVSSYPFFGSSTSVIQLRLANVALTPPPPEVPALTPAGLVLLVAALAGLGCGAGLRTRRRGGRG